MVFKFHFGYVLCFRFLGASKAILTFKTQQDMQFAAHEEKDFWGNYFEELRPLIYFHG